MLDCKIFSFRQFACLHASGFTKYHVALYQEHRLTVPVRYMDVYRRVVVTVEEEPESIFRE